MDLLRSNGQEYNTRAITSVLNKYFTKNDLDIRIINTNIVPDTFHCRFNAISRTYLYKLAIAQNMESQLPLTSPIPIESLRRCHFVW